MRTRTTNRGREPEFRHKVFTGGGDCLYYPYPVPLEGVK